MDDENLVHSGQQAFKLALRQSPKRICHAEIRDDDANIYVRACTRGMKEALLQCMSTSLRTRRTQ